MEVVVYGEPIYGLNDILSVDDELLACQRSLQNAAGKLYRIWAVKRALESLFATCVI